ncbi:hypothetical protein [Oceanihabitans sediminis]|uniref:Uncharacterized protein n=1 Tax=Oceanihabitans sediminis TaxID=1812012 RepID=A0A368P4U6_9FLAO|nr:hypothetical protein [Oceanihabitans sediminis]MDX1278473.1 hypothetical protein [Oceanihabitans sediminis]MDX1773545.1 hypothetical protein [Oceanihabitans sediminis]RBP32984.1 hypothetical protein DFR65_102320 [Oceanihabitans sediminis]RCU57498.1 hypothetical protein DU428_06795 [Oceanihabitans sediminis]
MNSALESSICNSCTFITDCSLTENKNFIWSCSEYQKVSNSNIDYDINTEKGILGYQTAKEIL